MAKVLQNFLIGVGLDTEKYDKGAKAVEGSLGRMRTLVGFTGAAITGAFAAAGGAAIAAGNRVDRFGLSVEKLRTSPAWINNYGNAVAALGGNFDDAAAAVNAAENALAQFRLKGDFGSFQEAAFAGLRDELNTLTQAQTGQEFIRVLADVVPRMDKDQQRLIQDAWGLSDGVMRSLRGGLGELDAAVARAGELYGEFGRATEEAREFNRALAEINTRFEGIGETLAEKMLPGFTGLIDSMGGVIDRNRDLLGLAATKMGENPTATALAAGGGAASAAGAALRGIGLRGVGMGLTRLAGTPGLIAGGGLMAYDSAKDWEWGDWWRQSKESAGEAWERWMWKEDHSRLPDAPYGSEVPVVAPRSSAPIEHSQSAPNTHTSYGTAFQPVVNNYYGLEVPTAPDWADPYAGVADPPQPIYSPNIQVAAPEWPISYPFAAEGSWPTVEPNIHDAAPNLPQPVYYGGEVSNSEAAQASPEIIMLNDNRLQSERPAGTPRINVQNHLEVQMDIDGRAIDSRVVDVIERRERDAADDIYSSVDR